MAGNLEPPKPALKLAPSAKEALQLFISQVTDMRPVISLRWAIGARSGDPKTGKWRTLDPHWGVGAYDAASFPAALRMMEIDGIAFAYGFESDHLFDGGTLHFKDGLFHVERS